MFLKNKTLECFLDQWCPVHAVSTYDASLRSIKTWNLQLRLDLPIFLSLSLQVWKKKLAFELSQCIDNFRLV